MKINLGLNFYSVSPLLFNPSELEDENLRSYLSTNKYHIYIVCKRKKLYYKESILEKGICKTTFYYLDQDHEKIYINYLHNPDDLQITSHFNGAFEVTLKNKDERISVYNLIGHLDCLTSQRLPSEFPSDLEVIYIGQAFGRTEVKTIDYRVSNHEKVQKIALDIIQKGTNEEILVLGAKIETNDFGVSVAKIGSNTKAPTLEDLKKLVDDAKQRPSEGQEVTIYEAALIKYFKPYLNTEYKENFPSKDYKSINEIYKTKFDHISIELDTTQALHRLFSQEQAEKKYSHNTYYPLTTKSEKKEFFEYIYELNEKKMH